MKRRAHREDGTEVDAFHGCLFLRSAVWCRCKSLITKKITGLGGCIMDDLEKYIQRRKKRSKKFADGFEVGYEQFKIGVMLRVAREEAGLTQDDVADRLNTKKSAISRMENHAEDIRLSTLEKFAEAIGKRLTLKIA